MTYSFCDAGWKVRGLGLRFGVRSERYNVWSKRYEGVAFRVLIFGARRACCFCAASASGEMTGAAGAGGSVWGLGIGVQGLGFRIQGSGGRI